MPLGSDHHRRDCFNVLIRNSVVKEVAHGVDEDHFGCLPAQRLGELFRYQAKIEALLVGMAGDAAKTLGEHFGVAVLASGAYFCATAYGVPGCVGPFDCGVLSHLEPPHSARIWRKYLSLSCLQLAVAQIGRASFRSR